MAVQINSFTTLPTGFTSISPLDVLIARSGNDVVRSTTQQAFPGADGLQVRFNGVGLTYDADGHITGGTVTSIQLVTIDQFNNVTVQETVAGFAIAGATFQAALNVSTLALAQLIFNGADAFVGSTLADNLVGHAGSDLLLGNGGDDTLTGGLGADTLNGGAGFDTADYSDSHGNPSAIKGVQINLGAGTANDWAGNTDTIVSIERVIGTQFNDTMIGTVANETFIGLEGPDGFVGNAGIDTVDYSLDAKFGGNTGVTVNLTTGVGTDSFGATDGYSGIENVVGTEFDDKITGGAGPNVLRGLGGNDILDGVSPGADVMAGGAGNDTYIFTNGAQVVDEVQDNGAGTDEVQSSISVDLRNTTQFLGAIENLTLTGAAAVVGIGNDLANVIKGNDIANVLSGQSGDDTMSGNGGNDTMTGDGGNDTLDGGVGDDNINGGTGNDKMTGGDGDDTLVGGDGNDRLDGGAGSNNLQGGAGDDTYVLGNHPIGQDTINDTGGQHDVVETSITRDLRDFTGIEDATLAGSAGGNLTGNNADNILTGDDSANVLTGLDGNDTLNGNGGNDTLSGGEGNDVLNGGAGNDTADGGNGDDTIDGGDGNDNLSGGAGADNIVGGAGFDTLAGGDGNDKLDGGLGDDIVGGGAGDDSMTGGDGNDTLTDTLGNNTFDGGAGNDTMIGGAGNDTFTGGAGNDTATGGGGQNSFNGGDGDDLFNGGGDVFDFGDGGAGNDIFNGSDGADNFTGGDGNDTLNGNGGADVLNGGAGDDRLVGGAALDNLTGGAGRDVFVFNFKSKADRDIISDFNHADDTIQLSKAAFKAFGAKIDGGEFFKGTKAHDANDHLIYNKANGAIYYDDDGTGHHAQVLIGQLSNHPNNIAVNDFVLV